MTIDDGVGTETAYTVTGQTGGPGVFFRVLAANDVGISPPSDVAMAR